MSVLISPEIVVFTFRPNINLKKSVLICKESKVPVVSIKLLANRLLHSETEYVYIAYVSGKADKAYYNSRHGNLNI